MISGLTPEGCRRRQQSFLELLERRQVNLAVITDWRDVYYFTGAISEVPYPRALVLGPGQPVRLVAETEYANAVADIQGVYPLQMLATLSFQPNQELRQELIRHLPRAERVGIQLEALRFSVGQSVIEKTGGELIALDDEILRLQATKDPDEIAILRRCNELNDRGYVAVQKAIRAGVTEAEVLAAGKKEVTAAAGCDCFYSGDFRCGQPGGFASNRACREGELYIVDAWVQYKGYWSDNCRTFPVSQMNQVQRRAWEMTETTVLEAEKLIRPGVRCQNVFRVMAEMQDRIRPGALSHHGGHGTGLRNHTYPRINAHFDDVFSENNVITIEPGVYGEDLRGGIRLECNYLVTSDGLERLNRFPISAPQ